MSRTILIRSYPAFAGAGLSGMTCSLLRVPGKAIRDDQPDRRRLRRGAETGCARDRPLHAGGAVYSAAIRGDAFRAPRGKTGKGLAVQPIELILP